MAWEFSETTKNCLCRWLERAAAEPSVPIELDETLNEYHLVHPSPGGVGEGRMVLRYCPFCGCKAPASRRSSLFAEITQEEILRLRALTYNIRTVDDALEALGQPDDEVSGGGQLTVPARGSQPPAMIFCVKTLHYRTLSRTADVQIQVPAQGHVQVLFFPKPIGQI